MHQSPAATACAVRIAVNISCILNINIIGIVAQSSPVESFKFALFSLIPNFMFVVYFRGARIAH